MSYTDHDVRKLQERVGELEGLLERERGWKDELTEEVFAYKRRIEKLESEIVDGYVKIRNLNNLNLKLGEELWPAKDRVKHLEQRLADGGPKSVISEGASVVLSMICNEIGEPDHEAALSRMRNDRSAMMAKLREVTKQRDDAENLLAEIGLPQKDGGEQ